jgi:hypothetical protein
MSLLEGSVDLTHKTIRRDKTVAPMFVEIRCRMGCAHFALRVTIVHHALYSVAHTYDHVSKCLQVSAVRHFSSCRDDALLTVRPG